MEEKRHIQHFLLRNKAMTTAIEHAGEKGEKENGVFQVEVREQKACPLERLEQPSMLRLEPSTEVSFVVACNLALRRKGRKPRRCDEITPLFQHFQ